MSVGRSIQELGRCRSVARRSRRSAATCHAAACLAIAALLSAGTAGAARADTPFGGEPGGQVTAEASCPQTTCTFFWTGPRGTDLAPVPAAAGGGSGTITSVTLPAMPEPGTMQAVVLTGTFQSSDPGHPTSCCAVTELSAPFTVPANTIATVPLSLHVGATESVKASIPGSTFYGDGIAISLLTPNASAPVRLTENPADSLTFWIPGLTAPSQSFLTPGGDTTGYEVEARFTFAETSVGKAPPSAPGGPAAPGRGSGRPKDGVKLRGSQLRAGGGDRLLTLGTATNPPTVSTIQKLTVPAAVGSAASAASAGRKPLVLGVGKTTVPDGKSAPLRLTLNGKGRAALAKGRPLKATLTIVATNAAAESETLIRHVIVTPDTPRPKKSGRLFGPPRLLP